MEEGVGVEETQHSVQTHEAKQKLFSLRFLNLLLDDIVYDEVAWVV